MQIRILLVVLLALMLAGCLSHVKQLVIFPTTPCAENYYEGEEKCTYWFLYQRHYESRTSFTR